MVTITDSSLRQTVWETIYDLLDGVTYGTSTEPTITSAFISGEHSPFPQIVVYPINVDKQTPSIGPDRLTCNKDIFVNIGIFTKKNKDLDVIADLIDTTIRGTNISGIDLTNGREDSGEDYPNDQKVRVKSLSYTFIRR